MTWGHPYISGELALLLRRKMILLLEKILLKCTGKEVTINKYGMQPELREGLNVGSKSAE